jgi:hypothetical protein
MSFASFILSRRKALTPRAQSRLGQFLRWLHWVRMEDAEGGGRGDLGAELGLDEEGEGQLRADVN